jgi:hypothetical protein
MTLQVLSLLPEITLPQSREMLSIVGEFLTLKGATTVKPKVSIRANSRDQ